MKIMNTSCMLLALCFAATAQNKPAASAKSLVSKMTLEEKMSQLAYGAPAIERLGVPAYNWWNEGLHGVARAGVATSFPQAIALSAMFDREALKSVSRATALEGRAIQPLDDRTLWGLGTSGEDSLAAAAVDRFCLSLGSVAGDLALAQGASGVVIAGGLGLRIKDTLLRSGFANRFTAKGRFAELMGKLPVKLITHPQPGLFGAAAAFAKEHLS